MLLTGAFSYPPPERSSLMVANESGNALRLAIACCNVLVITIVLDDEFKKKNKVCGNAGILF